ncbi:MAG: hypothetical protein IJO96_09515 [Oscillospiraceae bacterium]|nr:hypothetical protein [Oscillospiraceae bacterium]
MSNCNPTDKEICDLFTSQNYRHTEMTAAIAGYNLSGYPVNGVNIMEHSQLNLLAAKNGMKNPDYVNDHIEVYKNAQYAIGTDFIDQWIPGNPLSMGDKGYEHGAFSNTTAPTEIVVDGMKIEEPEDVVEHMERFVFPRLQKEAAEYDIEKRIRDIGIRMYNAQHEMGLDILLTCYGFTPMPTLWYSVYGYENYFMAYTLYEDVMERHFKLQAEVCRKANEAAAEAMNRYNFPKLCRLDHDMTDSQNTLVNINSLERIWFPNLAYALEPLLQKTDTRLIWHCDGNITPMVPALLDVGIRGFQGFQYECGVDYTKLCKMRGNDGQPLFMIAGSSVTRTLPFGKPEDVRNEIKFLVENRGDAAITLGCSSSMTPGVSSENIDTMIECFKYYKNHLK